MAGSRSVWMPVRLTKPSTSTRMTATRMVNGFLTLYFGMEVFPFFSDRPVGRIYYSTLTAGCKGLRVQRAMEMPKGIGIRPMAYGQALTLIALCEAP